MQSVLQGYARDRRRIKGCHHFQGKSHHIKGMKKVKVSNKKMKKYKDLYEVEKRKYEEALQRYREDDYGQSGDYQPTQTKKGAKAVPKAGSNTGSKATSKGSRSGCHLFLREQF